jgi:hypothetical protein
MGIYRLEGGRITEAWFAEDVVAMLKGLQINTLLPDLATRP